MLCNRLVHFGYGEADLLDRYAGRLSYPWTQRDKGDRDRLEVRAIRIAQVTTIAAVALAGPQISQCCPSAWPPLIATAYGIPDWCDMVSAAARACVLAPGMGPKQFALILNAMARVS